MEIRHGHFLPMRRSAARPQRLGKKKARRLAATLEEDATPLSGACHFAPPWLDEDLNIPIGRRSHAFANKLSGVLALV
jgi:hypothetical protein